MKKYFIAKVWVLDDCKRSLPKRLLVEADDYGMAEKMIEDYSIPGYLQIDEMSLSNFSGVYLTDLERRYVVDMVTDRDRHIMVLVGASDERFLHENVSEWALGADWIEWYRSDISYWLADFDYVLRDVSDMLEKF